MKIFLTATLLALSSAGTIVDLAVATPDLSTLVDALQKGKLVSTLSGTGPFTVFAPTNEAFKNLPAGTLEHLLEPRYIRELDKVLTYHVLSGAVFSKDLKPFQRVKTLEGDDLKIVKAGRVLVNNATVTSADNAASNGVVHIINGVLIPPAPPAPTPFSPTPAPKGDHLWFRGVSCTEEGGGQELCRCGEVDAAPRMPAALFLPDNAKALQRYKDVTVKFYDYSLLPGQHAVGPLEVGRCSEAGFTTSIGSMAGIPWAAGPELMNPICEEKCNCRFSFYPTNSTYPLCKDQPDDPKAGKFCSLCGPKYNEPVSISLFNGDCRPQDKGTCTGNEPYACTRGQCAHSKYGDLTKESCDRLCK